MAVARLVGLLALSMANQTIQRLARREGCDSAAAFDGLCPYAGWSGKASRDTERKRWALVSFSDRWLSQLTRPSLHEFVAARPWYDLLLEEEPLLDARDWHPAWNKLAYARRALILGTYKAVVCLDDDILITNPKIDPIADAIETYFAAHQAKLVVASLDEQVHARVPFNTGVLALRSSQETLMLLDEVFRIGRRLKLVNGYTWLPRVTGLWDQDAFAEYVDQYGASRFALLPHGQLQSFVRRGHSLWSAGHFAAHFTGLAELDAEDRADLLKGFLLGLTA
ncbi:unnamed protein product [Effrenium voratum]|nr:unnamed protein product [Effrenium voratum]CAJ1452283.1 unnamed protein product [Effrenium voratum]